MHTKRPVLPRALLLTCLAAAPPAAGAQEIYRWVDENGVVNFSDTAPARPAEGGVGTVVVEDTRPSDYDPEEDRYDVAGQAERMQALREVLAEQREARRASARSTPVPAAPARAPEPVYDLPAWWSGPGYGRPPGRPPKPEWPVEPPVEPPAPPTATLKPPPWDGD